jgi:hypothetical protein
MTQPSSNAGTGRYLKPRWPVTAAGMADPGMPLSIWVGLAARGDLLCGARSSWPQLAVRPWSSRPAWPLAGPFSLMLAGLPQASSPEAWIVPSLAGCMRRRHGGRRSP